MTSSENEPRDGRPVGRRALVIGGVAAAAGATAFGVGAAIGNGRASAPSPTPTTPVSPPSTPTPTATTPSAEPTPAPTPTPTPTPGIDLTANSVDDPASVWVVVNKLRTLSPIDYVPADLVSPDVPYVNRQPMRQATADALVALFSAAVAEAGLSLAVQSAYRSYDTQVSVYAGWVSTRGQAGADATSARPGHSEHQTGWAVDVVGASGACALEICWGDTPEGQWVGANAHRFGFLVRYRPESTPITGYESEPYHLRYVGTELSQYLHDSGIETLERLFGLPDAPDYAAGTVS
ncbi:D-Ala-D-Ala carboxypeptidase. Metallo peptidase. MEROPS family M15B [Rathayibacter oskolensis]|uniref:D-Ala-D-Ala carboxypeptidase. Metallo peptidase. MEROPS family M15B n=1 Tax=Rathayibacter oskolensis TaxID=1891671 RepID=A0A1X7MZR5_9MICO|nr:M15 family metallopeptidase [Rathayibacter oskolensis]SMH30402.1 D-Ala-D-Ala carboxypeptidase. Metallo peptidase. MEROPS family M15B [Rathayibacter oskolensis]